MGSIFMSNLIIFRGDVWMVDLNPTIGHEIAKKRPCVVISVDNYNQGTSNLAVVLPITSKFKPLSWLIFIEPPEGGLSLRSYIIGNQLRTVSLDRFTGERLGILKQKTIEQIEVRLRILLGL